MVDQAELGKHTGHAVAIREDEDGLITLECDTCGEYIAD
jgi:hypothetical protein